MCSSGDPYDTVRCLRPGRGYRRSAWWYVRRVEGGIVFDVVKRVLRRLSSMPSLFTVPQLSSTELG